MICPRCRYPLEASVAECPSCGTPVPETASSPDSLDWRDQVREKVARHREKRRVQQERFEEDARQLSIFPDADAEDEESLSQQKRRAEIRARVEQRVSKQRSSRFPGRRIDAGELPLGRSYAGAAARELATAPDREIVRDIEDPTTAELLPIRSSSPEPDFEISGEERAEASGPFSTLALATGFERILSGLVDLGFVVLIQLTLFYLTANLIAHRLPALPRSALVAMGLVGAVMGAGYFLFFWSLSGQTLGSLLTGSRVVDRKGHALGFGRSTMRLFGALLAALPLGAGFLGFWTHPERRGWHDRIAGTKVVKA